MKCCEFEFISAISRECMSVDDAGRMDVLSANQSKAFELGVNLISIETRFLTFLIRR